MTRHDLLDDVRDLARHKPGMILIGAGAAGAFAAGVAAGRLTRGARRSDGGIPAPRSESDEPRGTASGHPTAGAGRPGMEPSYPAGVSGVSEQATGEALDPDIEATPGTPPGGLRGSNVADQPFTDGPLRRGAI